MKNSASMRPDQLLVITQGVRGGKHHSNLQGQCKMKVTKGYNEPENSILIDVFEGLGHNYTPAEIAKINISFADGKEWNGNFESLKKLVCAPKNSFLAVTEVGRSKHTKGKITGDLYEIKNNIPVRISGFGFPMQSHAGIDTEIVKQLVIFGALPGNKINAEGYIDQQKKDYTLTIVDGRGLNYVSII